MNILVTGSSGHLGEGLMRVLRARGTSVCGLDIKPGRFTDRIGSIANRPLVRELMQDVDAIIHSATLHKPHVGTHDKSDFIETNINGTLVLLEEAVAADIGTFVFTSTTSAFGGALTPPSGRPAAWIDEAVVSVPKNIYGVTKTAAEDLCHLFNRQAGLNAIVLRTSRFFPEEDDNRAIRDGFSDQNAKANEFLYRRVDIEDVVSAHLNAIDHAAIVGFGKYIISATTPFERENLHALRLDPASVVEMHVPGFQKIYDSKGYGMFSSIDRIYDNSAARRDLNWKPTYDFARILNQVDSGSPIGSDLARNIGKLGYHDEKFEDGPYPVE
ncbi:MAG: NAD(P)-dependent oxidoreductase [Stappiaceae bacterium]